VIRIIYVLFFEPINDPPVVRSLSPVPLKAAEGMVVFPFK
jgi:hypothetical protein